jgi:Kef-type K+ transport system membrane component KefB
MPDVSLSGLAIISAVAFTVPLALGLAPRLRLPSVVLEIVAGIVIGPAVLGWVKPDLPIQVLALIGLAFLLFLAGLEIELDHLRGRVLRLAGLAYAVSFGLALVAGSLLHAAGLVRSPLLITIILASTALGIITPLLKDAGQSTSQFGQLLIAAGSIADFGAIILLSLFFSKEARGAGAQIILLGGFGLLVAAVALALFRVERSRRISQVLLRLQDTTAQIRVRGAFVLLVAFAALAQHLGLEAILGAFLAGAILTIVDRDRVMTHPEFRTKLSAAGFGIFIPVYFVSSGVNYHLHALLAGPSTIARVPLFLLALLIVRGLPTLLYRPVVGNRRTIVAGLLQATSLPFIVAASQIGQELHLITAATSAALIAAGLLSVLIFPLAAITILRGAPQTSLRAGGETSGARRILAAGPALLTVDPPPR